MARPRNRKRQRTDESGQESSPRHDPPAKKIKTRSEIELDAWAAWEYPPEFWDRLSKIELTHRALKELNRRFSTWHSPPFPSPPSPKRREFTQHLASTKTSRDLAQFARHGGPDLCHLRGYPEPTKNRPVSGVMSSNQSSRSRRTKSTDPKSTLPTSATTKTKKSTPYGRDFDLHLTDHQLRAPYSSQRPDLTHTRAALAATRSSLSPSKFSDGAFESFQESDARAKDEGDVLADVIPTILGQKQASHPVARNTVFGNLDPITDGSIAPPKPDIYYGANPEGLAQSARDELAGHIIPSTMQDKPMAPNLFMEVKGPDGSLAVALRQARYDGAIGSRAIHSLQNYNEEEPVYDGKPYTFSSIYHGGQLQLYAHHTTAPTAPDGRPEYHMTQIRTFGMTDTRETFVQGATAFRNARDLAKQHRDGFIQEANAKVSRARTAATQVDPAEPHQNEISTPHEPVDPAHHIVLQDANDELQQQIAETSYYDFEDDDEAPEEDSQEAIQEASQEAASGDPSMSFTSSFTSGFSADQSRSKRPRQSLRPRSESSGSAPKSRVRPSAAQRTTGSSTSAAGSVSSGPGDSHWVGTYWRRGKVYFRDLGGFEVKTELKDWTERTVDGCKCFNWQDSKSGQTFWAISLPKETKKGSGRH